MLNFSSRQGVFLLIIALFFLSSFVLISSAKLLQQSNFSYDKKKYAENYAKNLLIEFFENGRLKQQIYAQSVDYFSHQIGANMLLPVVNIYAFEQQTQPEWQITAKYAELYPVDSQVKLMENVRLKQFAILDNAVYLSSQLITDSLTILLDKQVALSQESVKIEHSSSVVEGIGLKLDFMQQNYQILQNVRMRRLNDEI